MIDIDYHDITAAFASAATALNISVGDLTIRLLFSVITGVLTWCITRSIPKIYNYIKKK